MMLPLFTYPPWRQILDSNLHCVRVDMLKCSSYYWHYPCRRKTDTMAYELFEVGIDAGRVSVQRTAGMDLKEVKHKYGGRFCIIGNVDSSVTLPFGTVDEVIAEAREAIEIASPGGGFILASDQSLHDGIPIENITALRDAGLKYGKVY